MGLYAQLPEMGDGDRVAEAVPAYGSILELGCGTGQIMQQLVRSASTSRRWTSPRRSSATAPPRQRRDHKDGERLTPHSTLRLLHQRIKRERTRKCSSRWIR